MPSANRKFKSSALPAVSIPSDEDVPLDASAVIAAIQDILAG